MRTHGLTFQASLPNLSRIHGLNNMADRSQIEAEFGILICENQDFQRKSTRGALI
jgi:hypothetical protein